MKRTRKKTKARTRRDPYRLRVATVLIVFALVFSVLIARAVDLPLEPAHDTAGRVERFRQRYSGTAQKESGE